MKYLLVILITLIGHAVAVQTPDDLFLNITFPSQSDTVNADKIRISGATLPDATLRINDRKTSLFPQGSFATRVNLQEGMNQIIIMAQKGDELVQDILFIYRPEQLTSLDSIPTLIDKTLLEPAADIWMMNGDYLSVKCTGSPGGTAHFSVEKLGKNFPMVELPVEQTRGVEGIYHGIVKLADLPENRPLKIEFELYGVDRKKKRRPAPGKLYILSTQIPLIGQTVNTTYIHCSPAGYLPLSRIPDSVKVHIIGRENRRFKINLLDRIGYIDTRNIKLLSAGTPLPHTTIAAPRIRQDNDWLHFTLPIGDRLPFQLKVETDPLVVQLVVWGARQASHWITYPNTDMDLKNLIFEQTDEHIFRLSAELAQDKAWGYKAYYQDAALHLSIRRQPTLDPDNPVANLNFAIDPGHGGEETGATSPLGVFEKDINRIWADELVTILRKNGARVFVTREADETVSLRQRIQRAEKANSHFFISLHNNATTASGNPLKAQGTSVYFTLAQNKELSWAIYPHMVKLGLAPYGRIHNSYYITNSSSFLVTLVEGGFLTNPYEELLLADEEFIHRMAQAVYNGIVDYLKAQTE